LFHPLHGGPDGTAPRTVGLAGVRTAVLALPEVRSVAQLALRSDPARQLIDDAGQVTGVRLLAGELADPRILLSVV